MLYQGSKQSKGLKLRKNKAFGLPKRKRRGPNPLRVHKKGPKSMWASFGLHKIKEEKKSQPSPQRLENR